MFESRPAPAEEPGDAVDDRVQGFGVEAWRLAAWAVEDAERAGESVVGPHWSELASWDREYAPSGEVLLVDACAQPTGMGLVGCLERIDPAVERGSWRVMRASASGPRVPVQR